MFRSVFFLSGGYDSTAVAALLQKNRTQKIKTFTIGFEDKRYDEAPFAKEIAERLGTDHVEWYCSEKDLLSIMPKLASIYDEPFADSSAIPTTLVSQLAKQHVTVSLSADGGDEIFGGYTKYLSQIKLLQCIYRCRHLLKIPAYCLDKLIMNEQSNHKWNFDTKMYLGE